jgi:hypothetical protein
MNQLTRQEARLYRKLRSGFTFHNTKWDIRFITVTSSEVSLNGNLSYDWKRLVQRIRRLTPLRLYKSGYLTMDQIKRFYRSRSLTEPISFEYCAIETDEGNGVIHAPCITQYIPQKWLSDTWQKIHSASVVDIRWCKDKPDEVREGGMRGLANYCLQKYLVGQSIIRSYTSRGWLKRGYSRMCKIIWKQTQEKKEYISILTMWLLGQSSSLDRLLREMEEQLLPKEAYYKIGVRTASVGKKSNARRKPMNQVLQFSFVTGKGEY